MREESRPSPRNRSAAAAGEASLQSQPLRCGHGTVRAHGRCDGCRSGVVRVNVAACPNRLPAAMAAGRRDRPSSSCAERPGRSASFPESGQNTIGTSQDRSAAGSGAWSGCTAAQTGGGQQFAIAVMIAGFTRCSMVVLSWRIEDSSILDRRSRRRQRGLAQPSGFGGRERASATAVDHPGRGTRAVRAVALGSAARSRRLADRPRVSGSSRTGSPATTSRARACRRADQAGRPGASQATAR